MTLVIDGGWSEWCPFTACSVTCGGGVRNRSRACTNPPPQGGGQDCLGPDSESKKCNTQSCRKYEGFIINLTMHFSVKISSVIAKLRLVTGYAEF